MESSFFNPVRGVRESSGVKWLALCLGVLVWTVSGVVLTAVAYLVWPEPRAIWQEYVASFSAFIPLFAVLLLTPLIFGRRIASALTSVARPRWALVWLGFWSWGLLLICESLFKFLREPRDMQFTFDLSSYLMAFVVSLFLLPIQTSSEEMLFRGAIPQTLSTIAKNPVVIVFVSGVLFGAAHLSNPEAQKQPLISLAGYSIAGIGWGWVTYRTGGLELAIGAHTVNNFYGLLVVGYSNSAVQGSSIWTTPEVDMAQSTVLNLIMMTIWILALRRLSLRFR